MREWIPVSTSARGRLVVAALHLFGSRPFESVSVGDVAAEAGVTTGALYHHFGSKSGLFAFVRHDLDQRVCDRIHGAASAAPPDLKVQAALLTSFDFAVQEGFASLLSASVTVDTDIVAATFAQVLGDDTDTGIVLAATWRAALQLALASADPTSARRALCRLHVAEH